MRNNVIAFGFLFAIVTAELWAVLVHGDGMYETLTSKTGECRGVTSRYNSNWGLSHWDCDGNRLPDEQPVNVDVPETTSTQEGSPGDLATTGPHNLSTAYPGGER